MKKEYFKKKQSWDTKDRQISNTNSILAQDEENRRKKLDTLSSQTLKLLKSERDADVKEMSRLKTLAELAYVRTTNCASALEKQAEATPSDTTAKFDWEKWQKQPKLQPPSQAPPIEETGVPVR